jgi:hypothetical protein
VLKRLATPEETFSLSSPHSSMLLSKILLKLFVFNQIPGKCMKSKVAILICLGIQPDNLECGRNDQLGSDTEYITGVLNDPGISHS